MSRFIDTRYKDLEPYVPGEQSQTQTFIKLNTNENPYPPSPAVKAALTGEEIDKLRLYSDPNAWQLCKAAGDYYGISPYQVLPCNGSDEALAFAFLAFFGDKGVAFPAITYGLYTVFANLFGVKTRQVPLNSDFTINIGDYLTPGENVLIANPNAPTGLALSHGEIETILKAHPNDVVLIDEAYVDFGCESLVQLLHQYENLLVIQTCSKSRSLAGQRVGFAFGSEALINDLRAMKDSFNPYNVDRLAILAGSAAMNDKAYFDECCSRIIATREKTTAALRQAGFVMADSKTNFIFTTYPGLSGAVLQQKLRDKGFLIRRFDQELIKDYLRISIGREADMEKLTAALIECVKECKA